MKKDLLEKFAKLAVYNGVNVQKDQELFINAPVIAHEFVYLISKYAYEKGAKEVFINWNFDKLSRLNMEKQSIDTIKEIPNFVIERYKHIVDRKACLLSISAITPNLYEGIDPKKLKESALASNSKLKFYKEFTMANKTQWSIIGYPTKEWAKKVFPNINEDEAYEKLFEAILNASRVTKNNDPVEEWKAHNKRLQEINKKLNDFNFDRLEFKNELGTNLIIGLADDHIWAGGCEYSCDGVLFNPNIPTEETFTMPHKDRVNGRVYSTKPLSYQGNLIEEFYLDFKDGVVVNYDALKGKEALKNLLTLDNGSKRIGEIALISYDSPISNMNILFYNTLFDENASCHIALGNAYPMNIKNGTNMSIEELRKRGYNESMTHVDFMFGSKDMEIFGITKDDKKIQIFKKGNFII